MLQDSMKESAAVATFLKSQSLPAQQVDCAKLAWHAACLWQRQQDIELISNALTANEWTVSGVVKVISEQRTLHLP